MPTPPLLLTFLAAFFLCFSVSTCKPQPQASKQTPTGTGKSFFSSGPESLAWDSDELQRLRSLHSRDFTDQDKFLASSNLASYLGLSRVDAIHLPVPVNVLFLGFGGDGHMEVNYSPEEVASWFEHMDHVIPHTRVPLSEISCKEDGHCTGLDGSRRPRPLPSYVHLNVSLHAVEVSHDVLEKVEKAMEAFARPVDVRYATGPQQVDAASFESVIDGLLNDLGLLWSYSIVVLNPRNTPTGQSYAYRVGLSKQEIEVLTTNPKLLEKLQKIVKGLPDTPRSPPKWAGFSRGWHPSRPSGKFSVNNVQYEGSQWARRINDWLDDRERKVNKLKEKLEGYQAVVGGLLDTRGFHGEADLSALLQTLAENQEHRGNDTLFKGKLRVMEPEEGCMVDAWLGHERWVMMDLSVMGLDWGPYVGGDGVKTAKSMPLVVMHFHPHLGGKKYGNVDRSDPKHDQMVQILEEERSETLNAVVSEHAAAMGQRNEPSDVAQKREKFDVGDVPQEVLMQAEMDVYERFAEEHCAGVVNPPPLCGDLADRIGALMNDMQALSDSTGSQVDFDRDHEWNIFGIADEVLTEEMAAPEARSKDLFMAHLAAVISKAIRHVFVPPSLAWNQNLGSVSDMGLPYTKKVTFNMYMIMDSARRSSNQASANKDLEFVNTFKSEVMGMKLDHQDFKFVVKRMRITDDPGLAGALSMSIKTVTLPLLHKDDHAVDKRVYFDSDELRQLLKGRIIGESKENVRRSAVDANLEVPIFILYLNRDEPVFIDEHYVAKSMEDMVVVVHNSNFKGQHPMGIVCNGNVVGQMISAPLKSALAATLQHLGGLVPPHLGYSPSHKMITHDWMWSTGTHPFSLTSPGWKVSQIQKDAMHRRYVLDALDASVEMVNEGIRILETERPSGKSFEKLKPLSGTMVSMLKEFSMLVEYWRRIANDAGDVDFNRAAAKIPDVQKSAWRFLEQAKEIEAVLHPLNCSSPSKLRWGVPDEVLGIALLLGLAVVVFRMLPRKRKKKTF